MNSIRARFENLGWYFVGGQVVPQRKNGPIWVRHSLRPGPTSSRSALVLYIPVLLHGEATLSAGGPGIRTLITGRIGGNLKHHHAVNLLRFQPEETYPAASTEREWLYVGGEERARVAMNSLRRQGTDSAALTRECLLLAA